MNGKLKSFAALAIIQVLFLKACNPFRLSGRQHQDVSTNPNNHVSKGVCHHFGIHMSPIGIPKVAYKQPGTTITQWEDIHSRLFRERIIFVSQELENDYVNNLIGSLLCLDNESVDKPITLYINSPGGSMEPGLALYDTLKQIKSEVITINVGLCASTATLLLGGGTPGKRFGLLHSRVLLLQPSGTAEGTAEHIRIEAEQILKIKKMIVQIYSDVTKQPVEKLESDIDRDYFMSVEESKNYGIIDHVLGEKGDELNKL